MRIINSKVIRQSIRDLAIKANIDLRPDVLRVLKAKLKFEKNMRARRALESIIENANIAKKEHLAICQDTGLPVVFADIGDEVFIRGNIYSAVQQGIKDGYNKAHLRQSVVLDPLRQTIKTGFTPAVVNVRIVKGKRLTLTVLPKGFGSENKSVLKMFNPTAPVNEVVAWVLEAVKAAGPDACPPFVLGIGIGGTADEAARLAKQALLRPIDKKNKDRSLSSLEKMISKAVNSTGIGPFGLGGKTTALAVNIKTAPTHIAGLPVAVNISCHALRSATKRL